MNSISTTPSRCAAVFFILLAFFSFQPAAAGSPEHNLVEKLYDVRALIEAGVSFDEYSRQVTEVVILSQRYKRAGGNNVRLGIVVDHLVAAKNHLVGKQEAETERLRNAKERQAQVEWEGAFNSLNFYEEGKKKK